MTVPSEVTNVSYVGSGGTGPFTVPFYFLEDDDLLVIKKEIATGAEVILGLTTDYTVSGAGDPAGGTITTVAVVAATHEIHILLDPDALQAIDYAANDPFPAETHERGLDKLTQLVQRLRTNVKRSIKAPKTVTDDIEIDGDSWAARFSKVLGFDAGGNLDVFDETQLAALLSGAAPDFFSQRFSGDASTVNFVLSAAPAEADALAIYISGIRQVPGIDYTLVAATVTFTTAPPLGTNNILAVWSDVVPVSVTPADGSVTTPKLADGALAATAAGLAKMAAGFLQATADGLAKMADGFFQVGGHTKFVDSFWAASAAVRAKFADGIWTFAKIDPAALASQAEAEAGTSALKLMTPQRTKQAIDALAGSVNVGTMQVIGADCKNNAATPDTQYDLDADIIVLRNVSNQIVTRFNPGAAITNNVSTAGPAANGRDQAGAFSADSWIHFYWIWNGTTLATLSSAVAPPTGPTLPTGYTHWAYAGAVRFGAGSTLVKTRIKGSRAYYEARQQALNNGASAVEASVSVSSYVPPNALAMTLLAQASSGQAAGVTDSSVSLRHTSGSIFAEMLLYMSNGASDTEARDSITVEMPNVGQQFYYDWTLPGTNTGSLDVWVIGYKLPNGGE